MSLGPGLRWHGLELGAGLGGRVGLVRFTGAASAAKVRAETFQAPWVGLAALAGARLPIGGRFGLRVTLEAGIALLAARALVDGAAEAVLGGPWLMIGLGGFARP